jgi:AbrB family looped-hinge helix DNA binding protein
MPMITLRGKGQVTIPGTLRRELQLSPGDVLEATVEGGRLVMIPKAMIDRGVLMREMNEAFNSPVTDSFSGMNEDEIMLAAEQIVNEDNQ